MLGWTDSRAGRSQGGSEEAGNGNRPSPSPLLITATAPSPPPHRHPLPTTLLPHLPLLPTHRQPLQQATASGAEGITAEHRWKPHLGRTMPWRRAYISAGTRAVCVLRMCLTETNRAPGTRCVMKQKYASIYFRAKYDGHCAVCQNAFHAGMEIARCLDRSGYRHRECYETYRPMR